MTDKNIQFLKHVYDADGAFKLKRAAAILGQPVARVASCIPHYLPEVSMPLFVHFTKGEPTLGHRYYGGDDLGSITKLMVEDDSENTIGYYIAATEKPHKKEYVKVDLEEKEHGRYAGKWLEEAIHNSYVLASASSETPKSEPVVYKLDDEAWLRPASDIPSEDIFAKIMNRLIGLIGNPKTAFLWFETETIHGLGNATAKQLLAMGQGDKVLDYLDGVVSGAFE